MKSSISGIYAVFLLSVCLVFSSNAQAVTDTSNGTAGAPDPALPNPGPAGNPGGAGGNGSDGGEGPAVAKDAIGPGNTARGTGGKGAAGGMGGLGNVPGASGGLGGTGGNGGKGSGTAFINAPLVGGTADATGNGGLGGNGGTGGIGNTFASGGKGGDGGSGGNGIAEAGTNSGTATATAQGGNGGSAGAGGTGPQGGPGGLGGKGGMADSKAIDQLGLTTGNNRATARGGNGGAGGNGGTGTVLGNPGDGGDGGDANAKAAARDANARTQGGLGGEGGVAGQRRGNGGNGGNAIADALSGGSSIARATGGNGATNSGGNGGKGTATALSNNPNGNASSNAIAEGGAGRVTKNGGDAIATANATGTGIANASAHATGGISGNRGGKPGTAKASAEATGGDGMTDVGAEVVQEPGGRIKSSKASGKAPVKGNAKAQAQAAIGATLASLKPNTTLQSFASATGDPLPADVLAETAATPNVTANLHIGDGSNVLGLVALGGLYPNIAIASGISATSSSSAAFEIDTTGFEGSTLRIGLLEGLATGFGFDSLLFRIIENGTMVEEEMFTSLESALSFFDDNVLDLGPGMAGPSGFLELQFDLDVIAHRSGDGFSVNLVAAVPEPGMLTLLSIAVLDLDRYRRAKRSPP